MSEGSDVDMDPDLWDDRGPRAVLTEFLEEPDYWEVMGATFEFLTDKETVGTFSPEDVEVLENDSEWMVEKGGGMIVVQKDPEETVHGSNVNYVTPANKVESIIGARREVTLDARV